MRHTSRRCYGLTCLLLSAILTVALGVWAPRSVQAASWSAPARISNGSGFGIFPDIVTDSQGVTHVVYTETPDFNTSRIVRYTNNRSGQWSPPLTLSRGGLFADLGRLSTVTLNGKVYLAVVYKGKLGGPTTSRIYYRLSTDGGQNWGPEEQVEGVTGFEPALVLDDTGQPHITFTQQVDETTFPLLYTTKTASGWTPPVKFSNDDELFNRDASITYTRSGGTLYLHVLYMGVPTTGVELPKSIYYTRKIGAGGWSFPRLRQETGAAYPKIIGDGQSRLYGTWHAQDSSYFYEPFFSRSLDNGISWSSPIPNGTLTTDISASPAIARTSSGVMAMVWEDQYGTSDNRRDIYARISENDGVSWGNFQAIQKAPGFSREVEVAAGAEGFRAAWHDDLSGAYQIYTSAYSLAPVIRAVPQIENGATITKKSRVDVNFTNVSGTPTQVRWRWDTRLSDPASENEWGPFATTLQVDAPSDITGACSTRTLYTQVRNASATGQVESDAVIFDRDVQAVVVAVNPHMAGLPPLYTSGSVGINDLLDQGGASDGAPNYSRDHAFFLGVTDFSECAGLKDVTVTGGLATTTIPDGGYKNTVPLPGDMRIGPKQVNIIVTDKVTPTPNTRPYTTTIIYDPSDTDPSPTVNNTDGLPVLANGGSVTGDSNTGSVLRTLTFSNISVSDNLYGKQGENLPSGRQFWGVWVANVLESADKGPDDSNLRWYPVRVPAPGPSFSIEWSLFTGLNYGLDTSKSGNYVVYVRFLDGAGNPSAGSLKTTLTLDPGYTFPSRWLPIIGK